MWSLCWWRVFVENVELVSNNWYLKCCQWHNKLSSMIDLNRRLHVLVCTVLSCPRRSWLARASDSCLMCDYVHVINFQIIIIRIGDKSRLSTTETSKLFCPFSKCVEDYWKQSWLVVNTVHTSDKTVLSCVSCELGFTVRKLTQLIGEWMHIFMLCHKLLFPVKP